MLFLQLKTFSNSLWNKMWFTLQWLQFRMLYMLLQVENYLKKISIKPSDCCRFCDKNVETILHIFFSCEKNSTIVERVESLYLSKVVLMCRTLFFWKFLLSFHNKVINFIILHVKQYNFTCLLQNNMQNLRGLLCYLNLKYKV